MTNKGIQTLNQAEQHLRETNSVITNSTGVECVDGLTLLDVCGYKYIVTTNGDRQKDKSKRVIDRQITKHGFIEGQDYVTRVVTKQGHHKKVEYRFTLEAANHVLLAAMTNQGKQARKQAIDLAMSVQTNPVSCIGSEYATAYIGAAQYRAGLPNTKRVQWKESFKADIKDNGVLAATETFINSTGSNVVNRLVEQDRADLLAEAEVIIKGVQDTYRRESDTFDMVEFNNYNKAALLLADRRAKVQQRYITKLNK